ncbi:hypothetical protein E1176_09950 [Fulvivirga sp. RKSG066]|uniref:NDR1/HIN1-like protein n=1 Tax=Fulvivirga aurantia TaxID=2529383 RepID=UPI0012BC45B6|nr:LEA type 2 family protein [Fulvivirga aurantia]MTI21341.1 hypothetical protein [Fulvivirga aurantia]
MRRNILILLGIVMMIGCTRPEEVPVFKGVGNIKVSKVQGTKAYLNADAYFYNPNDVKMKIKSVDIGVHLNGKPIGVINQSMKTKVPAKSNFKVPLDATFDIKEEGALQNIIGLLGGRKKEVFYKGYIKVSVHGWPVRVPVEYSDEVRLKF